MLQGIVYYKYYVVTYKCDDNDCPKYLYDTIKYTGIRNPCSFYLGNMAVFAFLSI